MRVDEAAGWFGGHGGDWVRAFGGEFAAALWGGHGGKLDGFWRSMHIC